MTPVHPSPHSLPWTHGHVDALMEMEENLEHLRSYHRLPAHRKESFENAFISSFLERFRSAGLQNIVLFALVRRPSLMSLPSGRDVEKILDELQNSPSLPNGAMASPVHVPPNYVTQNPPFLPYGPMSAAHALPNYVLPTQYFPSFMPYGPMAPAHFLPNVAQMAHIAHMAPQISQPNPSLNQKCAEFPPVTVRGANTNQGLSCISGSDNSAQACSSVTSFPRVDEFDIKVGNHTFQNNGRWPKAKVVARVLQDLFPTKGLLCPSGKKLYQQRTQFPTQEKGASTHSYKNVFSIAVVMTTIGLCSHFPSFFHSRVRKRVYRTVNQ